MSDLKYNRVTRDHEPRSYNLCNSEDKSYQFYFRFIEPVKFHSREGVSYGVSVKQDCIDEIPSNGTPLEIAEAILAYKKRFFYSGDIKDLELVVEFLRKHDYQDGRLSLLDEIDRLAKKLAAKRKEYENSFGEELPA